MPSSLLQVVNSLFQTCYNNWEQAVRTQLVDNLCVFNVNTGKNMQVVTDLQTSCNKVVVKPISGCVRTACSQLLWQVWNKLLSPCYKVDDGNRLATSCSNKTNTGSVRNKLLRACCHQLVASLVASSTLLQYDNNLCQTWQGFWRQALNNS
jgi:hypothetical protein